MTAPEDALTGDALTAWRSYNPQPANDVAAELAKWTTTMQRAVDDGATFTMSFGFDGDELAFALETGFDCSRFGCEHNNCGGA